MLRNPGSRPMWSAAVSNCSSAAWSAAVPGDTSEGVPSVRGSAAKMLFIVCTGTRWHGKPNTSLAQHEQNVKSSRELQIHVLFIGLPAPFNVRLIPSSNREQQRLSDTTGYSLHARKARQHFRLRHVRVADLWSPDFPRRARLLL